MQGSLRIEGSDLLLIGLLQGITFVLNNRELYT
jgi:hypothetical protein